MLLVALCYTVVIFNIIMDIFGEHLLDSLPYPAHDVVNYLIFMYRFKSNIIESSTGIEYIQGVTNNGIKCFSSEPHEI